MPDRSPFTRHRRTRQLDAYWDSVVEGDGSLPIVPVDVDREDALLVRRMQSLANSPVPDADFAARLEQKLMNTYIPQATSPLTEVLPGIPQRRPDLPPSRNGSRDSGPISHRRALEPPPRTGRTPIPALHIGLAILLVLASIGGTWWMSNRQDEPRLMMAPVAMTNPDYSDHPIVGAWEVDEGIPCWCVMVFTGDGIAIGMDPSPDISTDGLSSYPVAMGIWQPTDDQTVTGIVRFPAKAGGYIERTIRWEMNEDGNSMLGWGTQRIVRPDGTTEDLGSSPPIDAVRMAMPDATSDGAPIATPDN